MSKRTDYHRNYYRENREALAERKQEQRDQFERATSYWRQRLCFGRECKWLLHDVPEATVDRARVEYEKVLDQHEPASVEKKRSVSTGKS
jgi:hypothetical protein